MSNTVKLHRVFTCPPERLYRAFIDPLALVKWMAPHGFVAQVHSMDARVGGSYRMSFKNFTTGDTHSFGGTYKEMKPNELLKYTDKFEPPGPPGEMTNTVTFKKVSVGTELTITQENLPPMIPVEACYVGWGESLQLLQQLVQAEVPAEQDLPKQ